MPDLGGRDAETLAEDCFEEGAGQGLGRFEAGEVREDVGLRFLGVAYPTRAGGGKDGLFGRR